MTSPAPQRVALACCGLGHVRRGNETWAHTVAEALHAAGEPITLFTGGPLQAAVPIAPVWNIPRDTRWLSRFSWHHRYMLEQKTFFWALNRKLNRGTHDIVHVADPQVAWWFRKRSATTGIPTIYKDGLLLGPQWMSNFAWNQVLAPFYKSEGERLGFDVRRWFVIPHLVDVQQFQPAADKSADQEKILGKRLDPSALVLLAVGALGAGNNKRLDYVAREVASLGVTSTHLVVAGQASPVERAEFEQRFRPVLGDRLHLLTNVSSAEMPSVYRCADAFVHGALREPFGIVFIEAMASGLAVAAHEFEVTRWIVGEGGEIGNLNEAGRLASVIRGWIANPAERMALGHKARDRAVRAFSPGQIVPHYREMYATIRAETGGDR